jgi:hypothetical protein
MDAGKVRMDQTTAVHVLRRTAIVCTLIWLIPPVVVAALTWANWQLALQMLLELPIALSQLLAVAAIASAMLAVSGPFPEKWKLSADVLVFAALAAAFSAVGISSSSGFVVFPVRDGMWGVLADTPVTLLYWVRNLHPNAFYGIPLAADALVLWVAVRVWHGWRWPGAGAGHFLAAGAMLVYGGVLSVAALVSWPAGLGVAAVCAYGVCYALGLATIRADEFQAACRPGAGPRAVPSVPLTALLFALAVGGSVPWAWATADRLLHPGIIS